MPDISPGEDAWLKVDNQTWANARGKASATTTNASPSGAQILARKQSTTYDVYRYFLAFDTSAIDAVPRSATLKLRGFSAGTADLIVVRVNPNATGDSGTNFVAGDFSKVSFTDPYSAEVDTWSTSGFNSIVLNRQAREAMKNFDEFKIAVIDHDHDYQNVAPTGATVSVTRALGASASLRPYITYDPRSIKRENRDERRKRKTRGARGKGFSRKNISVQTGGRTVTNGFSE